MKVLITGTGRCGTTFLMRLLTLLHCDTGFTAETMSQYIFRNCNSGLEKVPPRGYQFPIHTYTKCPRLSLEIIHGSNVFPYDWYIVPVRDVEECTQSRVRMGISKPGGFHPNASDVASERNINIDIQRNLPSAIETKQKGRVLLLEFTRMINDPRYLFETLRPLNDSHCNDWPRFESAFRTASALSKKK